MQILTGHHTCDNTRNASAIVKAGLPIAKAKFDPQKDENPFLGSGYYLGDYNMGMARQWGYMHCKNRYYVFEADIPYDDRMLDLVGNRKHMEWLTNSMAEYSAENSNAGNWDISTFIEFLKEVAESENDPDIFPFESIRAIDHSAKIKDEDKYRFHEGEQHRGLIILNPRIIICVITDDKSIIQNLRLKHECW